jgi:hypothetical protein
MQRAGAHEVRGRKCGHGTHGQVGVARVLNRLRAVAGGRRQATASPQATGHRLAALLCLICGIVPIGIAFGVIPARPGSIRAPLFIVALAGLLFWFAAASLLFGSTRPRLNSLLGAMLFALFATIGGWVSVFGTGIAFRGGVSVVSSDANEWMARVIFGLGALVCAACSLYALKRAIRTVA